MGLVSFYVFMLEKGAQYNIADWQGNNVDVINRSGKIVQTTAYYPYGEPTIEPSGQRFLYGGKEREHGGGRNTYDFSARSLIAPLGQWCVPDRKAEKTPGQSIYSFCGGDPINNIDPDGEEWRLVTSEIGNELRFEWVDSKNAYDEDGVLLPNHYVQAISFSKEGVNGTFDDTKKYNIGTSTATVYKADGSTEDFDASTYPAKVDKYPTVPAGHYEAKVGKHKGTYDALRVSDVGTENFMNNSIELGEPNKAHPTRTTANGINIHKAGYENLTGLTRSGVGVSEGCFLIDRFKWNDFIKIFNSPDQRNNVIGIIVIR